MIPIAQPSIASWINRYPEIFLESAAYFRKPIRILSFGCAKGEELSSINMYFDNCIIEGCDINPICEQISEIVASKITGKKNTVSVVRTPIFGYSLIFAMSVLCYHIGDKRDKKYTYPFEKFIEAIEYLDSLLADGGMLCIYNSQYRFCDVSISSKYLPYRTQESGSVPKLVPGTNDAIVEPYNHAVFIKTGK